MSTFIETARNIVAGVQLIDNTIREADTERAELIMAIVAALEQAAALHSANVRGKEVPGYPRRQCEPGRLTQIEFKP